MGRIALRRLTLNNFRSFKGLHTLDFPESGLVILRGENRDTGGDSGAGKTNVLLALAYVFGYARYGAPALQSWFDEAPMYVEVDLDTPEGPVTVRRGIKGISIGKIKGKPAEAKLDQLLGVPTDLREILTYRDQVKPKKFLSMGDTALKEFLVEVLQLHGLEAEIEAAIKLLGELAKKCEAASAFLFNTQQDHERRQNELQPFHPEDTSALEGQLGRAHVEVSRLSSGLQANAYELATIESEEKAGAATLWTNHMAEASALDKELQGLRAPVPALDRSAADAVKAQLDKCETFLKQLETADQVASDTYASETQALRMRARKLHNELARVPGLVDTLIRLQAEADKLAEDRCDRCDRQWENARLALEAHQRQIAEVQGALDAARAHKHDAAALDEEISGRRFEADPRIEKLRTVRSNLKSQLAAEEQKLKSEAARAAAEVHQARAALEARIAAAKAEARAASQDYLQAPERLSRALRAAQDVLKRDLAVAELKVMSTNSQLVEVRTANRLGLAHHDQLVQHLAEAEKRLTKARVEHEAVELAWKAQADYVDLLKGFRNKIFDEVLEAIGNDASGIIATLPNSQHISIEFRSDKETQKGKVQEKITPITYLYGVPRSLDESVSGGQRTSIGLAVDLAVAGVICRRLGVYLNWIVLDESFEGHDPITKQHCLEMLQSYAADKLVIIVDHMNEIKETFSKEICVVFENKLSSLKVAA
jgi:chromosome segregation ATPase